jgi:Glycosyltransferase like family
LISYVVCQAPDSLFTLRGMPALRRQCDRFGAELIVVRHPTSIFAAYEQGRRAAKHELIVYVHDDVELVDPTTSQKIARFFANDRKLGLLGVLGSREGDIVPWWENSTLLGHYLMPDQLRVVGGLERLRRLAYSRLGTRRTAQYVYAADTGGFDIERVDLSAGAVAVWESRAPIARWQGTRVAALLDGVLLAERRNDLPWDTTTFEGWHCYDLDRSCAIRAAGWKVAVGDLLLMHDQREHGEDWRAGHEWALRAFARKWGVFPSRGELSEDWTRMQT